MKVVNYQGTKVRVLKGQTLAIVNEYGRGKWAKPRKTLCLINQHYFKNGNAKRGEFDIVKTLKVVQEGYTWDYWVGKNYDIIWSEV